MAQNVSDPADRMQPETLIRSLLIRMTRWHVIIDEAQDLHLLQWRLLRAAVPPGPDDMCIVGDVHQRIYDNRGDRSDRA
jgi:superfamily I DNA/RNA helicase